MRVNFSMYTSVIDGGENIVVKNYNGNVIYNGKKVDCPFVDADVVAVYTENGNIVIEVI